MTVETPIPLRYPLYSPSLGELEKKYVNDCLDSSWISSKGTYIQRFEQKFAQMTGVRYATSVCNGTVALHLALLAIGIQPGDEVIVPTFTYIASVNAIVHAGAKPVFVDSLLSSWQMDPEEIEKKITPSTKAIMAVHLYGRACNMRKIQEICRHHHLLLIEDCAEAFGTRFEEMHVGSFGDVATFSFFGNKTITTGEGGMVVTNHLPIFENAVHLKTQGVSPDKVYWHTRIGYNYRMTNICAAIGLAQLERAHLIVEKKRALAHWYAHFLKDLPLLADSEPKDTVSSFWMCSILLDNPEDRNPLRAHLTEKGIETRPFFYPAHQMPMYAAEKSYFPIAENLSCRGINLPSYPSLEKEDVREIANQIRSFFV